MIRTAEYNYYQKKVAEVELVNPAKWWREIKILAGQDAKQVWYHRQTTLRRRERVTSRYFETVITADSTNRGKCSIKTSNRDVSFRKLILWTAI